jgi:hypothetical protein
MAGLRPLLRIAGGALAFALYVWFAAVRNAGRVKRRKEARRLRRGAVYRSGETAERVQRRRPY